MKRDYEMNPQPRPRGSLLRKMREEKFNRLTAEYKESCEVQRMGGFIQHGDTTTLEHCLKVAWICFVLNEMLHLKSNEKELIAAAMLHDFYLYDWHDGKPERKTHGFDHPFIASENAKTYFNISQKVSTAIQSHMWPLNFKKIPKSREAIILCLADKYCALAEIVGKKQKK